MIRMTGCPSPQPSSSAVFPLSMPICTALVLLFMLTTACARLSLLDNGCSGIVNFNSATVNASTRGARLVKMHFDLSTSSLSMAAGRAREASSSDGLRGCPYRGLIFFGDSDDPGPEASLKDRFFDTRLAALRTCRATFSSSNMVLRLWKSPFARSAARRALSDWTRRGCTLSRAYAWPI